MTRAVNIYTNSKQIVQNLYVNGKPVKSRFDKYILKYVCHFETDLSTIEIEVKQSHYLLNKLYLFLEIVFYIISFFGLFDERQTRSNNLFYYRSTFTLSSSTNDIELQYLNANIEASKQFLGRAFVATKTNLHYSIISNVDFLCEELIRRRKIIKKTKIGVFFGILLIAALIVVLTVFVFKK